MLNEVKQGEKMFKPAFQLERNHGYVEGARKAPTENRLQRTNAFDVEIIEILNGFILKAEIKSNAHYEERARLLSI